MFNVITSCYNENVAVLWQFDVVRLLTVGKGDR